MVNFKIPDKLAEGGNVPDIAPGPFIVRHNGNSYVGTSMRLLNDDSFTFWDGSRLHEVDETYAIRSGHARLECYSKEYESRYEFEPLTLKIADELYPDEGYTDLAVFRDDLIASFHASGQLNHDIPGGAMLAAGAPTSILPNGKSLPLIEGDSLCATEDDEENVLELVFSDETGIHVRTPEKTWEIMTDAQSPSIEDRVWVDVTEAFVPVYDAAREADDDMVDADVEQYRADAG